MFRAGQGGAACPQMAGEDSPSSGCAVGAAWADVMLDMDLDSGSDGGGGDVDAVVVPDAHMGQAQSGNPAVIAKAVGCNEFLSSVLAALGKVGKHHGAFRAAANLQMVVHAAPSDGLQIVAAASGGPEVDGCSREDDIAMRELPRAALEELVRALELSKDIPGQTAILTDSECLKVARHWMLDKTSLQSAVAAAASLGVTEHRLLSMKNRCCMAAVVLERLEALRAMEGIVADVEASNGELISFYTISRYDETPMKFRIPDDLSRDCLKKSAKQLDEVSAPLRLQFTDALPQKVLRSQLAVALLVRVRNRLWHFTFPLTCWLQPMATTTHSCYWRALQGQLLACSHISEKFARRQRLASTDGDGAVAKAERGFSKQAGPVDELHILCQVHRSANIRGATMALAKGTVQALIRASLSLKFGNAMSSFRLAFRDIVAETLRYERGNPPPEHKAHRDVFLTMFCPANDRTSRLRRVILEVLCNGNWAADRLEHFCCGCCENREDCVRKMQIYLSAVFLSCAPRTFERKRWTGQEHSTRLIGLFEGVNRLFSRTYRRFAERLGKPRQPNATPVDVGLAAALGDEAPPETEPDNFTGAAEGAEAMWEARRLEQSKFRATVCDWVDGLGPMCDLLVVGHVVEVLQAYTAGLLYRGGKQWETMQHRAAATAFIGEAGGEGREYCVVLAAQGVLEKRALADVRNRLINPKLWLATPPALRTLACRALAFRMLSRLCCLLHKVQRDYSKYPFRTFLLLTDSSFEHVVQAEQCRWDSWTAAFCRDHTARGLASPIALADLRSVAASVKTDTAQIEALHATMRRQAQISSCQTHAEALLDASCETILRRVRQHGPRFRDRVLGAHGEASGSAEDNVGDTTADKLPARGGGGPWRAFVALRAGAEGGDLKRVALQYAAMGEDEKHELLELGAIGTALHKAGVQRPFGGSKRQQERQERAMLKQNACEALLQARGGDIAEEAVVAAFSDCARGSGDLQGPEKSVRPVTTNTIFGCGRGGGVGGLVHPCYLRRDVHTIELGMLGMSLCAVLPNSFGSNPHWRIVM